ncbi:MAG TPA: substrate-binding protein [Rhodanobacteraceae bacterium]|nr:substrate-binding protein [Rhodanobacteraceae bacterium]
MSDSKHIGDGVDQADSVDGIEQPTRRLMLKGLAGAMGAAALGVPILSGLPFSARAAEHPALGNYPAGVKGDTVFVGQTVDLTGPYSAQGAEERMGYELAIEQLNAGAPGIKGLSPLTKKGLLGKQIVTGSADSETKPNSAVQAATRFIHTNKAMLVCGSTSSAVAIALEEYCNRERTPYMVAISGSTETTGSHCQRYGFRPGYYAYMGAKALAPVVAKAMGKNRKAAYLIPDYTYGHTTAQQFQDFSEKEGWKTVSKQVHPLGATDYSSYLINIANSGADTLICIDYGADAVNSLKQAKQFGLLAKMKVVIPYMSPFLGDSLGADIIQGAYACADFWWTLANDPKYPGAKTFVDAFQKKYGKKPQGSACTAYVGLGLWADAVERAGSFYPPDVVKALEAGVHRQGPVGSIWFRGQDHQAAASFPILLGRKPAQVKSNDDLWDVVEVVDGASVLPPLSLFGCKLGPYV